MPCRLRQLRRTSCPRAPAEANQRYPLSAGARALGGEAESRRAMLDLSAVALAGPRAAEPPPSRLRLPRRSRRTLSRRSTPLTREEEHELSPPRQLVELTRYPRRVTSADADELRNAVDVSEFDQLDLLL